MREDYWKNEYRETERLEMTFKPETIKQLEELLETGKTCIIKQINGIVTVQAIETPTELFIPSIPILLARANKSCMLKLSVANDDRGWNEMVLLRLFPKGNLYLTSVNIHEDLDSEIQESQTVNKEG
jgi:hypothetical protein